MLVTTRAGKVRGLQRPGSLAFLGIPYAAAPVGEHRFQAPAPVAPWAEELDATAYGPTPQRRPFGPVTTIPEPSIPGDATLNLNVFTPSVDEKLPVLVWIHGGGYFAGSAASPWYDGRAFNRDGVVTVTVSYRLGFDGFGVIEGAPNNRGVLDQIAALQWVQENIAQFGGDPGRVTIAGQSAGGGSVLTLMCSPLARGLFHGAISQSGAMSRLTVSAARANTARLAEAAGVDGSLSSWLAVSEETVLDHQFPMQMAGMVGEPEPVSSLVARLRDTDQEIGLAFAPVVDGVTVLPFEEAPHRSIPLLLGTTLHEFPIPSPLLDPAEVTAALTGAGATSSSVRSFMAETDQIGPGFLRSQLLARAMFRLPAVHAASVRGAERTWLYDFRRTAQGIAAHCMEIPFAFDLLDASGVETVLGANPPQSLADAVHADWVHFVSRGVCAWPGGVGAQVYTEAGAAYDPEGYRLERELLAAA
ncbi:carboxylesterase family protein [Actinoplanes sp. NPDC051851]|uniref:carboxylesterase/lipase family protein n=1 Tax=Actinoplanes sp. NPDC051851 TaxID=3154753 RepID=UPI00342F12C0